MIYKIGTIGTSWITKSFISEVRDMPNFSIDLIYSRNIDKAKVFAEENLIKNHTNNFDDLKNVDVVYIASPNSIHYEQAVTLIKLKKHLVIEKPMSLTEEDTRSLFKLAELNNVIVIEGMRNIHGENSKIENVKSLSLKFQKKSSRFNEDGTLNRLDNVFIKSMGGGAIYDLGCYAISLALLYFSDLKVKDANLIKKVNDVDGTVSFTLYNDEVSIPISISKIIADNQSYLNGVLQDDSFISGGKGKTLRGYMESFYMMLNNNKDIYDKYKNISIKTATIIDDILQAIDY